MKKGMVLFLILFLGLNVVIVSASFLDMFKFGEKGSGEYGLSEQKATDVRLTLSGTGTSNPEIVYISDLSGKCCFPDGSGVCGLGGGPFCPEGIVQSSDRALLAGGIITTKTFNFYVYSPAGIDVLPTGTLTPSQAYVTLVHIGTGSQTGTKRKSTAACTFLGDDTNYDTGSDDILNLNRGILPVRKYQCSVDMFYYDDWGISSSPNWEVRAFIIDIFNNKEGYEWDGVTETWYNNGTPTGWGLPLRKSYLNQLEDIRLENSPLDFGSVTYGPDLNILPASTLILNNTGNTDITKTELTGFNIPKIDDATKLVPSVGFFTDPSTPCSTSRNLANATKVDSTIPTIYHAAVARDNVNICLDSLIYSPNTPLGEYTTTGPGGIKWLLETTHG
ncbi:MAG: hypothetical protein PHF67_04085 [Candidatus Nanoarchaeia archaeon]|nr:hypothetical protein [Candidatus Nanoarchaeia archaeon]